MDKTVEPLSGSDCTINLFAPSQIIREYVDGIDLETLLKNPSLCPALKSPERRLQGLAKERAQGCVNPAI